MATLVLQPHAHPPSSHLVSSSGQALCLPTQPLPVQPGPAPPSDRPLPAHSRYSIKNLRFVDSNIRSHLYLN